MRRILAAVVLVLLLGACSEGDDATGAEPSASPTLPVATVLLDNGEESTLVTVEVAETPEQQERALTDREPLPDDEGVVFVFFTEQDMTWSMADKKVPLSVALFDAGGTIVRIVDMDPCKDLCPIHRSDVPFMGALAVNQGAFDEWDISEGDHVQLTR